MSASRRQTFSWLTCYNAVHCHFYCRRLLQLLH